MGGGGERRGGIGGGGTTVLILANFCNHYIIREGTSKLPVFLVRTNTTHLDKYCPVYSYPIRVAFFLNKEVLMYGFTIHS